jgi:hypothetical protein
MTQLVGREDLESRVLRVELQAKADPGEEAVQEALEVGEAALAAGSERTARRALAAAERMADEGGANSSKIQELRSRLARS